MADPRVVHTGVTHAISAANVTRKLVDQQLSIIAPPPVIVNGCPLPSPPVAVTVGPFQFNILDWQKAAKGNVKELNFRGGIDEGTLSWLMNEYAKISSTAFRKGITMWRSGIGNMPPPKFDAGSRTLRVFAQSGGWGTFSKEYKGFNTGFDLPNIISGSLPPGMYWLWRELIDGKKPVAKVNPPFSDSGHDWGLYVTWLDRKVNGKDQVAVKLKQEARGFVGTIEYGVGEVISVIETGIEYLCKAITWDKLQEVRNFGTMFPNPTVSASVLAWQGVAQACGTNLPPQASGPPACVPTEPLPGLTALPWWKQYQAWLIAGGAALVGVGGIAYYRSRARP